SDVIAKFRPDFVKGTMDKGVSKENAEEIFELILKFGGYGFNKSHSTRYSVVAFQTAYLKTYHPIEYQAALLTYEMGNTEKLVEYIDETRSMKVNVLPPDVNQSGSDFTPVYEGKGRNTTGVIRFGLAAVRGVGEKAVEAIVAERSKSGAFKSLYDFCDRVDTRLISKSTVDALIRCGALSSMHDNRAAMLQALDGAFENAQRTQQDKAAGQSLLFGGGAGSSATPSTEQPLPKVKEFTKQELLQSEKELLGFFVSSDPLVDHQREIESYGSHTTKQAMLAQEGTAVIIPAMLTAIRSKVGKSGASEGKRWAIIEFTDLAGKMEGMVYANTFAEITARDPELLKSDRIVVIEGRVDRKRETPCLIVGKVSAIETIMFDKATEVILRLDARTHDGSTIEKMRTLTNKHVGGLEIGVFVTLEDGQVVRMKPTNRARLRPSADLLRDFEEALGPGSIELVGPRRKRPTEQLALISDPMVPPDLVESEFVLSELLD
ncbi:MAG TPA: hypothetical protein PK402_10715, partial [Tepidisphaeraceae bacterium]|nr:hypothetical protein [Tepidisphaeraceae bacterium]